MIITKKVKIKKNPSNYKKYLNLGYKEFDNFFEINVKDISKNSRVKIKAKCDFCGKEKETSYRLYIKNINNYNLFSCSNECSSFKNELTNLEKYGFNYPTKNSNVIIKIKKTNLERYGTEWFNESKFYKYDKVKKKEQYEKMKKVCKEKYNNEIYNKSEHSKERRNEVINKRKQTFKNKRFKKYPNLIKIKKNIFYFKCEKCNNEFEIERCQLKNREKYNIEKCTICNPIGKRYSYSESLFLQKLKKLTNYNIIVNSRKIIPPYELDVYIPKLNLAFEFNGLYWHNNKNKNANYHQNKSDLCLERKIYLIHIWEDELNLIDDFLQKAIKKEIIDNFDIKNNKIYNNNEFIGELEFKNNIIYINSFFNFNLENIFKLFPKYDILLNRDKDYSSENYKNKIKKNPIIIKTNIYNSGLYLIKN